MATVNYIPYQRQSAVSLGKIAGYVSQDEKTQDRRTGRKLVSGVRCSSHFAVQEFRAARTAHHKKSPVWFYHYTQSFSPKEPITGPQAHQLAKEFAEQAWPESQVLVATHVDARHIHSHFLVNAVCYESGKMLRQGPRTLEHLRNLSDQLCMKYHYRFVRGYHLPGARILLLPAGDCGAAWPGAESLPVRQRERESHPPGHFHKASAPNLRGKRFPGHLPPPHPSPLFRLHHAP